MAQVLRLGTSILVQGHFEAVFKAPIFADNESNCAAIAEMMWGAAAGCDDFVFFKIDVGVGGAIVVNRKVLTGKGGDAGEFSRTGRSLSAKAGNKRCSTA